MFRDLEEPGALTHTLSQIKKDIILLCSGPDTNSISMLRNTYSSIQYLGLESQVFILTDSMTTCNNIGFPMCRWSSRILRNPPSHSLSMQKYWDWRFKFYYVKKKLVADIVKSNRSVLQADTDTYWFRNPFPMLHQMNSSIIVQHDSPIANAGLIYTRPGSREASILLNDVAWRIQLFQNYPEIVGKIVSFAREPFYANSDDQTILNDAIQSAILHNMTFLGSIARMEAKNRHNNNRGPQWKSTREYQQNMKNIRDIKKISVREILLIENRKFYYTKYPISRYDSVAVAPAKIFSHVTSRTNDVYVMHLAALHGFQSKLIYLKKNKLWKI